MNTYRIIFADGTYKTVAALGPLTAIGIRGHAEGKVLAVIDEAILEADINHDAFLALNRFVWGS